MEKWADRTSSRGLSLRSCPALVVSACFRSQCLCRRLTDAVAPLGWKERAMSGKAAVAAVAPLGMVFEADEGPRACLRCTVAAVEAGPVPTASSSRAPSAKRTECAISMRPVRKVPRSAAWRTKLWSCRRRSPAPCRRRHGRAGCDHRPDRGAGRAPALGVGGPCAAQSQAGVRKPLELV